MAVEQDQQTIEALGIFGVSDDTFGSSDQSLLTEEQLLDPGYQNTLFIIENALQEAGAIPKPRGSYPTIFDAQLLELIDSVTLE